jgi:hypothetical protein
VVKIRVKPAWLLLRLLWRLHLLRALTQEAGRFSSRAETRLLLLLLLLPVLLRHLVQRELLHHWRRLLQLVGTLNGVASSWQGMQRCPRLRVLLRLLLPIAWRAVGRCGAAAGAWPCAACLAAPEAVQAGLYFLL